MTPRSLLPPLVILSCSLAFAAETIPPAFRAGRHGEEAEGYLQQLPDGAALSIKRTDGTSYRLSYSKGRFNVELPPATLNTALTEVVTPLGYRLSWKTDYNKPGFWVTSPNGAWTLFSFEAPTPGSKKVVAVEGDGNVWEQSGDAIVLRLVDGTRIDLLENGTRWEALTLRGERFALEAPDHLWKRLPTLPSPPLVPAMESYFASGEGDDWFRPAQDDHYVFAWNWFPYGLPMSRLLDDLRGGPRRDQLNYYFNELAEPQDPAEMAGALLALRFALSGGDSITIEVEGREPHTVWVLPGALEPKRLLPKRYSPYNAVYK